MSAETILHAAAKIVAGNADDRDQGQERSMARTVEIFNTATGHSITTRDGWLFMVALKLVRAGNTASGKPDDYLDLAAYGALAGESVEHREPVTELVEADAWCPWDEKWLAHDSVRPDFVTRRYDEYEVKLRSGEIAPVDDKVSWRDHYGQNSIVAYRRRDTPAPKYGTLPGHMIPAETRGPIPQNTVYHPTDDAFYDTVSGLMLDPNFRDTWYGIRDQFPNALTTPAPSAFGWGNSPPVVESFPAPLQNPWLDHNPPQGIGDFRPAVLIGNESEWEVKFRDGTTHQCHHAFTWSWSGVPGDIIAYRRKP